MWKSAQTGQTFVLGASTALLFASMIILAGISPLVIDDTFITLHYARMLLDHGFLTWWPTHPPVDGYTSLGHVLLLALLGLGGGDLLTINTLLNCSAAAGLLVVFVFATQGFPLWARLTGAAVLALNGSMIFWLAGGLDGILFALSFLATYLLMERAIATAEFGPAIAASLIIMALLRPEGALIALSLVAFFWLTRFLTIERKRVAAFWSAIPCAAILTLFLWRLTTYGHVFPNTYYAKASASRLLEVQAGAAYLLDWVSAQGGILLLILPIAALSGAASLLRVLFVAGFLAVIVVAGGDPHPAARFFLPIIALLALDVTASLALARPILRVSIVALLALYFAQQFMPIPGARLPITEIGRSFTAIAEGRWPRLSADTHPIVAAQRDAVREFERALRPATVVGASDVGALAYFSNLEILDASGLNHKAFAHLPKPTDRANTWGISRLPEIIEQGTSVIYLRFPYYDRWSWDEVARTGLCPESARLKATLWSAAPEAFDSDYQCTTLQSETWPGYVQNIMVRRGSEATLATDIDATHSSCVPAVKLACGLP